MAYIRTQKHKQAMSALKKAQWVNKTYRAKQLKASYQRWKDPEFRKKMQGKFGSKNPAWKGGRIKSIFGYIFILATEHPRRNGTGYVMEHRLVVEERIKRYLKPQEKVHHINHVKHDNRAENLMAFKNHSWHRKFESGKFVDPKHIIFDGNLLHSSSK